MTNPWLVAALVGCLALAASPARANWLSGADLERHCGAYLGDPVSSEAAGCIAFIQGYVAAAGANTSVDARDDAASFAERAARTRAGSRLRGMREELASREQLVHRALVAQFPCSDD
jgi:hypothetical protein